MGEGQNQNFIDGRCCESPVDYGLLEDDDGEWEPADDISYHTHYFHLNHSDTMKSMQSSSSAPPDIVHKKKSHKLNDDSQQESVSYRGKYNKNCDIGFQYKTICILYSEVIGETKLRAIIYDYKPLMYLPKNDDLLKLNNQAIRENYKIQNAGKIETSGSKCMDERTNHIEAWKSCLYMEDEEDMVRRTCYIRGVLKKATSNFASYENLIFDLKQNTCLSVRPLLTLRDAYLKALMLSDFLLPAFENADLAF